MKYVTSLMRTVHSFSSPRPLRDWVLVLSLGVIVLFALLGVSLYFFIGVRSGSIVNSSSGQTVTVPRISKPDLEALVGALETRRLNYESGNVTVPQVSDLSR